MTQQTAPFIETKYGWDYGESGWNGGMDENLLKYSILFDRNIDGIVSSLPSVVNGTAYFLTTNNRIYFGVNSAWYSSPVPKWFILVNKASGVTYQFNGTVLAQVDSPAEVEGRLDAVELTISTLGTAAYEDIAFFATQAELDIASAQSSTYTDTKVNTLSTNLSNNTSATLGSSLVGFKQSGTGSVGRSVQSKLRDSVSVRDFGAVGDGIADDGGALNNVRGVGIIPPGTYKSDASPLGSERVVCIGASFSGLGALDKWSPSFGGSFRVMDMTGSNALVGSAYNRNPANTAVFPTGVTGYGRSDNKGNQAFGVFGRADIYSSGGGVVTNEMNSFNFAGEPSSSLPPDRSFGTSQVLPIALTVAPGGAYDSSIGIHLSKEGESPQSFLTGIYINPDACKKYGVFIDSTSSSTHSPLVLGHAVGKIGIQVRGRGTPVASNAWISYTDGSGVNKFSVKQDGRISLPSTITQSTRGSAGAAAVLPSNPSGYVQVEIGGTIKVIPYYEA